MNVTSSFGILNFELIFLGLKALKRSIVSFVLYIPIRVVKSKPKLPFGCITRTITVSCRSLCDSEIVTVVLVIHLSTMFTKLFFILLMLVKPLKVQW